MNKNCPLFLLCYLLLLCLTQAFPTAFANTLDDLLKKVMAEREYESQEFQKREQTFKRERDKRKVLLNQAGRELKKEEAITRQLVKEFNKNEKELTILENELTIATGNLGELFGVVKQVAGDFRGHAMNSLISAEIPNREKFAEHISARKKLPTTEELRKLWFELQQEMTQQGKISRFSAEVIASDGSKAQRDVVRVGAFNLVSRGHYLNYQPEGGAVVELARQPERRWTSYISKMEKAKPETYPMFALDPTRGSLISLLIRKPSLFERIKQGGYVGLVIILVLLFGLAVVVERWVLIKKEAKKIREQLKNIHQPKSDNPLGQILSVYEKNKTLNMESLERKFNEIAIVYLPTVEKRIGIIKVLAGVAPLLGLLGTVTGMILTFQSITLFGTGDPKLMAGGISQALMTTVMGLCAAIPLLLSHSFISNQSQKIAQILEEQTAGLLAKKILTKSGEKV